MALVQIFVMAIYSLAEQCVMWKYERNYRDDQKEEKKVSKKVP